MEKFQRNSGGAIVEAVQVSDDNVDEIANWSQSQIVEERHALKHDEVFEALNVKTPDGKKRASRGSYVVKVGPFFYVVPQGTFEKNYRPVEKRKPHVPEQVRRVSPDDPFRGMTRFNDGPKP